MPTDAPLSQPAPGWRFGRRAQPGLRRRLLLWLVLPLPLLVPLTAALIYLQAISPALDALDHGLTDTAVALSRIIDVDGDRITLPLSPQTALALRAGQVGETDFAVADDQGRLLGGNAALLAMAPALQAGQWQFFESTLTGKPVRAAARAVACGRELARTCKVLVAETLDRRDAAKQAAGLAAILGALLLSLPTLLLAIVAVDRGMRPLQLAAAEVASRTPERLEPIDTGPVPREVVAFVQAVNGLLERLREAASAQRAFIADAAHQLRTPLSVLRVEAALVLQSPHPAALHPALQRLHAAAERGARLAQQLLVLASAEGAALDPARRARRVELDQLATEAGQQWLQPSLRAGQDLGFELEHAAVVGDPLLLAEMLGNLIHNAIEHAGAGARITVRTGVRGGQARLCVEDDGRGLADGEFALVWQRFRRGRDARGTGSGLGLAIVEDIARLHGARAEMAKGDRGRGLRVCITFAAAASPSSDFSSQAS